MEKNKQPNPGSDKAVKKGCTCPVMDNHRGRGLGRGNFWINGGCPLHGGGKKEENNND